MARRKAHFEFASYCSALKCKTKWRIEVSATGMIAKREMDGRTVSLSWREMIGMAIVYGRDANGK